MVAAGGLFGLGGMERALGLVYIAFCGALDVLAGIGTGLFVLCAPEANTPELSEAVGWLFA